jgi:MSHA biogenesis protein MshO
MSRPAKAAGFTLVELVVVIVLTAIVSSFIVLFLDAPLQSYFAQTASSNLVDSADRIAAAVNTDVRTALPNSLRIRIVGSRTALELLATEGVARYYGQGDNPAKPGEELIVGNATMGFATLDSFSSQPLPPKPYLSVGNLGTTASPPLGTSASPAYDAYVGGNGAMTPAGITVTVSTNPGYRGENLVTFNRKMTFQAPGPPGTQPSVHNAYLVSGPVSYVCDSGAGTLTRYSGYGVTAAQAVPPAGTSALLAQNVAACTMSIVSAPASYAYGELAILTVTLASGGQNLQVFLEAPVEYVQ